MKKSWVMFVLASFGAVVVGLWVFRKINPGSSVVSIPSGGAGTQSANPSGYKRETETSTIVIGPATVKESWDTSYANSLEDFR
jgi:hypothetical protein